MAKRRLRYSGTTRDTLASKKGYWYIRMPSHPYADSQGRVPEHKLIVSEKIGRLLESDEMVHHLDLNKHNNDSDNLEVCKDGEHRRFHEELEWIAVQLYRADLIYFKDGHYIMSNRLLDVLSELEER